MLSTLNKPTCGLLPRSTITAGRLPHTFTAYDITALSAGVKIHLRCIHKGLMAFSWVTTQIRMHDQTIFDAIFWFDVRTTIWRHWKLALDHTKFISHEDMKNKPWVGVYDWCATAYTLLETIRFSFWFDTITSIGDHPDHWLIQSSAVITQSKLSRYCHRHCDDSSRT